MARKLIGDMFVSTFAKDIGGRRYGKLTAIRPVKRNSDGKIIWLCHCDCGNEREVSIAMLREGTAKSCGCTNPRKETHPGWSGYEQITGTVWCSIREGAKNRHIPFNITKQQAWDLYIAQERKCAISGLLIGFGKPRTASLDRIDSQKEYSIGNIWWVHAKINRAKWVLSMDEFARYCGLVCSPLRGQSGCLAMPDKRDPKWTGAGNLPNWMVGRFKNIAKRRGFVFDDRLGVAHLWEAFVRQNGACALTGLPLMFPPHSYRRKDGTASLDRIDSSKGYVAGNIQWVHKVVNDMKGPLSDDEFRQVCSVVVDYDPSLKRSAGIGLVPRPC